MAYSQFTLSDVSAQLGILLDDTSAVYWVEDEKRFAIWEALRVWGALTNYWRQRGTFSWAPAATSPWTDLSVILPLLRTRTWTLDQMVREIQYMCLEAANGISGAGMSGQISITSILQSIQRGRNRFVLDAHLPLSVLSATFGSAPTDGLVTFDQSSVFVHRVNWQDGVSGAWTNLWREDAWAVDHASPSWTTETGSPTQYSESELAPLELQLSPIPSNGGVLETLIVPSQLMNLADPAATFNIPDEWVHAVKYAALSDLFSAESQNTDPLRAGYAESRYQQALTFARDARSMTRILVNGVPLPIDSLAAMDAGNPWWRNQTGSPLTAGVVYDLLAFSPGIADTTYAIGVDVSQSAPIPLAGADFLPIGDEDLDNIIDYATHILTFKCGGREFQQTFSGYDGFMSAVAARKGVNAAKVSYLEPSYGQPQREWNRRPDRIGAGR